MGYKELISDLRKVWEANQHTGRKYGFLPCLWSRPDRQGRGDGDGEIGGAAG